MTELTLESDVLPPLNSDLEPSQEYEDAPYGYKADGTPRQKPGRKPGATSGSGKSSSTSRGNRDANLSKRIADELVEVSAPLALLSPMAMVHIERRADKTGDALVSISKKYPRVAHAINAYFDSVAYKDIALFITGIPVAVMMDMRILQPDSKVGIPWHMQEIYEECYGENGTENEPAMAPRRGLAAEI